MIENIIEYREEEAPEGVVALISHAHRREGTTVENLQDEQIYAILEDTANAIYITLGYHLPREAARLESDTVFTQEFRIRLIEVDDDWCEQIMYRSTQIDPYERVGPDAKFVRIDETMYKEFYHALKDDGLFEWEETEERILAD